MLLRKNCCRVSELVQDTFPSYKGRRGSQKSFIQALRVPQYTEEEARPDCLVHSYYVFAPNHFPLIVQIDFVQLLLALYCLIIRCEFACSK